MGCIPCQNKVVNVVPFVPQQEVVQNTDCNIPYFNDLKNKLLLMKSLNQYIATTSQEVNSVLGLMTTMENYNNYCLYDLTNIQNRLANVNQV